MWRFVILWPVTIVVAFVGLCLIVAGWAIESSAKDVKEIGKDIRKICRGITGRNPEGYGPKDDVRQTMEELFRKR